MEPASERRRFYRAEIPGIQGSMKSPGDAAVVDLSLSGLAIETIEELEPGQRCFLELRHESHTVSVEGEVRWVSARRVIRTDNTLRPLFRAGLQLIDVWRDGASGIFEWLVPEAEAEVVTA